MGNEPNDDSNVEKIERAQRHWSAVEEGVDLLEDGKVDEALKLLELVAQHDEDNEYAHFFIGQAYYEQERYIDALAKYLRAIELAPSYWGACVGAGHCLRMMGRYDQAIRMGQEVLRCLPDDPDALYLLGVSYFQTGENKLAHGFLQRFLETNPDMEIAMEVEGMLQVIRGEVFGAVRTTDEEHLN